MVNVIDPDLIECIYDELVILKLLLITKKGVNPKRLPYYSEIVFAMQHLLKVPIVREGYPISSAEVLNLEPLSLKHFADGLYPLGEKLDNGKEKEELLVKCAKINQWLKNREFYSGLKIPLDKFTNVKYALNQVRDIIED